MQGLHSQQTSALSRGAIFTVDGYSPSTPAGAGSSPFKPETAAYERTQATTVNVGSPLHAPSRAPPRPPPRSSTAPPQSLERAARSRLHEPPSPSFKGWRASAPSPSPMLREATRGQLRLDRRDRFVDKHGESAARAIDRQIQHVRQLMRDQRRGKQFVLHPEHNRFVGRWDLLTMMALLYTATLTPFETSFMPPVVGAAAWSDPWFIVNRCLDVIFTFDMILQFFVAYQSGGGPHSHGAIRWVDNPKDIARHYLCSWFCLDAFTVFVPGGFDLYQTSSVFEDTSSQNGGSAAGSTGILRMLRVLRLIKARTGHGNAHPCMDQCRAHATTCNCTFSSIFSSTHLSMATRVLVRAAGTPCASFTPV